MNIIEGNIAVKAALNSKYRSVKMIYIQDDKHGKDISFIMDLAKKCNVCVKRISEQEIGELAIGKSHGGVLAQVGERKMQSIVSLLKDHNGFLALIEGVEDSFNLGYIMRSLYAFGCSGVILKERSINYQDNIIIKSSAGASELLPIVYSTDLEETLNILKNNNYKIVSAYRGSNASSLYDYDFSGSKTLVCVGGPLRGLSRIILDNSDAFVYIPYANDFRNSLNASSALSVIASEIYRQNNQNR